MCVHGSCPPLEPGDRRSVRKDYPRILDRLPQRNAAPSFGEDMGVAEYGVAALAELARSTTADAAVSRSPTKQSIPSTVRGRVRRTAMASRRAARGRLPGSCGRSA